MSSATWQEKMRALKNKLTVDDITKMFGWESPDEIQESVIRYGEEYYSDFYRSALQEGKSEEEAEKIARDGEQKILDELYAKYRRRVIQVAERLFEEHGLLLQEVAKSHGWEYRVIPKESWLDAASNLRQTINGYGLFHFNRVRDLLESGPYTARQAVLSHLHWIASWSEIYEGRKSQTLLGNWED